MNSLSAATHGFIPCLSPLKIGVHGLLGDCWESPVEPQYPAPSGGGGASRLHLGRRRRDLATREDVREAIREAEGVETVKRGDVVITRPVVIETVYQPLQAGLKPLQAFSDAIYRELIALLRIGEIQLHGLIQEVQADEQRKLEEELLIFMMLDD